MKNTEIGHIDYQELADRSTGLSGADIANVSNQAKINAINRNHDSIEDEEDPIAKTIARWCQDDKDRNVLYKKNGEERYPDFKLYKMIARTVHNHTPENEFDREEGNIFDKFLSSKKKMGGKKAKIFNVDDIPSYV